MQIGIYKPTLRTSMQIGIYKPTLRTSMQIGIYANVCICVVFVWEEARLSDLVATLALKCICISKQTSSFNEQL